MKRARKNLGVAFGNVLIFSVLLLAAEGLARWLCAGELEAIFPDRLTGSPPSPLIEAHPRRGVALRPLYRDELYSVNSDGFRGTELPSDLGERFLVAALGDSTTFGWGVAEGEDFPSRLTEILHDEGFPEVYVLNGGVPGYTSAQARRHLEEIAQGDLGPDLVVLSVLWNDLWYSTIADWHRDLLVYRAPRGAERWLRSYSGIYRCLVVYQASQSDFVDVWNEKAFAAYRDEIEKTFRLARHHSIPLVVFDPPIAAAQIPEHGINRFHIRYTREFFLETARSYVAAAEELAEAYGVPVAHHRLSIDHDGGEEFFLDPLHPDARGNRLLARDLATFLIDNGLLVSPR